MLLYCTVFIFIVGNRLKQAYRLQFEKIIKWLNLSWWVGITQRINIDFIVKYGSSDLRQRVFLLSPPDNYFDLWYSISSIYENKIKHTFAKS